MILQIQLSTIVLRFFKVKEIWEAEDILLKMLNVKKQMLERDKNLKNYLRNKNN